MSKSNWKEQLANLAPTSTPGEVEPLPAEPTSTAAEATSTKGQELLIRFEKRNGKPATIVSRFEGSETALKELAAALKKHCGTGGSAKDDEILIQGDVRHKVADFLRKRNYRVRGDLR
jgi:translation initiation factor 1